MAKRLEVFPVKWLAWSPPGDCHDFGIGELLATLAPTLFATEAGAATVGAEVLGGALGGAGLGAGESLITGGNPLTGALTGGLTGGVTGGLTGPISGALDLSPALVGPALGAGSGVLGSELTGGNPLIGALTGGAGGLVQGLGGISGIANDLGLTGSGSDLLGGASGAGGGVATSAGTLTGGETGAALSPGTTTAAAPIASGGASIPSSVPSSAGALSTEGTGLSTAGGPNLSTATPIDNWVGMLSETPATPSAATGAGATPTDISAQPGYTGSSEGIDFGGGSSPDTSLGGKVMGYLTNPGVLLGGGLAATSLLMNRGAGNVNNIPGATPVNQLASTLTQTGNTELAPLTTGRLPAGAQSSLDLTRANVDAQTRSQFASLGLTGSTMETQALNQNAQKIEAEKWAMINDLVGRGTSALGAAGTLDTTLMTQQIARDQATQNALARFAAALAGASGSRQAA